MAKSKDRSAVERQAPNNIDLLQLTALEKDIAKQLVIIVAIAILSRDHSAVTSQTSNNIGLP